MVAPLLLRPLPASSFCNAQCGEVEAMVRETPKGLFWVTWWTAAVVLAIIAVFLFTPSPARSQTVDVGVYAVASACSPDWLHCTALQITRHPDFVSCEARMRELRSPCYQRRYYISGRPVIMGRCRSWSPPVDWRQR